MDVRYGQWEYRVAVADAKQSRLESVDGEVGQVLLATDTVEPMTICQALDVWGATGWELVGMVPLPDGLLQYVLKRPRHQGGWKGARIHGESREV